MDRTITKRYQKDGVHLFVKDQTDFSKYSGLTANTSERVQRFRIVLTKKGDASLWYYIDAKKLVEIQCQLKEIQRLSKVDDVYSEAIKSLERISSSVENETITEELSKLKRNEKKIHIFNGFFPCPNRRMKKTPKKRLELALKLII